MSDEIHPIEELTQSVLAMLDLDPPGLSNQDISVNEPECMTPIDKINDGFTDTWGNIKSIIFEEMEEYEYATSYLDVADPSERLVISSELTNLLTKDCACLKVEYFTSGTVKISSRVNLNTSAKGIRQQRNPQADTSEIFICDYLESITPEQVRESRRRVLSLKNLSD